MLTRLRRSAGMLLVLFGGHLTMVTEGVVCTAPGMASMGGSLAQPESMATMPGMASSSMPEGLTTSGAEHASPEHEPCSNPSQTACVASMPCVIALGAPRAEGLVCPLFAPVLTVAALIVTMPATAGSAPELPPPRA